MKLRRILSTFLSASVLLVCVYGVIHKQDIQDWLKLRSYEPSLELSSIADVTEFTSLGKKLFFVHYPDLLIKEEFYGKCQNEEKASVLGCYYSNNKIYLLKVNEKKLEGIEEVTSAHEMLHAAYDRLSSSEREKIDALLYSVYKKLPEGQAKNDIASYDVTDKKLLYNELHSIIGTEVADIPTELEEYYKKYFNNRQTVVGFAASYDAEFTKLQSQIDDIDKQLELLKIDLDGLATELDLLFNAIENEKIIIEGLIGNPKVYNAALPSYNSKVIEYQRKAKAFNLKVAEYNNLIEQRKNIAIENNNLFDAIDTRLPEVVQ